MGHKSDSIFDRYAIADQVALEEGIEKLARLHAGVSGNEDRARSAVPIEEAREGAR